MSNRTTVSRLAAFAIVGAMLVTALPTGIASHRATYDDSGTVPGSGIRDEGLRMTYEPDFASTEIYTPGSPITNCIADLDPDMDYTAVTYGGTCDEAATADDLKANSGELFFDSMIFAQPASPGASEWFAYNHYRRTILGANDNVILPGKNGMFAWFGHWDDKNQDGKIDDICKFLAGATDEFIWRGQSTGENGGQWNAQSAPFKFIMRGWGDPGEFQSETATFPQIFDNIATDDYGIGEAIGFDIADGDGNLGVNRTQKNNPEVIYSDRTSEDAAASGCPSNTGYMSDNGNPFYAWENSLVWTTTIVTTVNPALLPIGDPRQYDISQALFTDVDKYASLNPTLEELYLSLNDQARSAEFGAGNATVAAIVMAGAVIDGVIEQANQTLIATCADLETQSGKDVCDPEGTACDEAAGAGADVCNAADPVGLVCAEVADQSGEDLCAFNPVTFVNSVRANAYGQYYAAAGSKLTRTQQPPMPHEPNTPFDEYSCGTELTSSCNATYGGTSYAAGGCATDTPDQPRGSCNSYAGYQSGWHAWIDSIPQQYFPTNHRPFVIPPQVGLSTGGGATFTPGNTPGVYTNSAGHGKYSDVAFAAGHNYHWTAAVGQWFDQNLDNWVHAGAFSAAQDAAYPYGNGTFVIGVGSTGFNDQGGTYRVQGGNNYTAWTAANPGFGEWLNACNLAGRVLDSRVKLVPMVNGELDATGSWGKGVIVRWNHMEPGKPTNGDNPGRTTFDLFTTGEIVLNESCAATTGTDAVAFLGANYDGIDFAVVTEVTMRVDTNPLSTDPDEAGRYVTETVVDVDVHTVTDE
ncbi:MAG: hypothetical protein HY556_11075 [Euryarchaeota archaeon]|nr:hypothetical protein [Euryarchaeota archaeon]